ncbi:MAG: LysR family transcriptional regulator [Pseudomonadota bacterium]
MMRNYEQIPISGDLLRSFLVIAATGNLTHAADRLGRTQSAISVQLRNLEQTLGATLFNRSVKGMTLTEAGERLLPKAEATVAQLQDMRRLFDAPLTGRLRIGIPDDYEGRILVGALARFARMHPGVEVTAHSGCTVAYAKDVREGQLDMAVCSGAEPRDGVPVSCEAAVWANARSITVPMDGPIPLAMLDRRCWWKSIPTDALRCAGRDYRVAFRTESFGSLMSALRSGLAIGVLPASCVDDELQVLDANHGLPRLPDIHRTILISDHTDKHVAQAMAEAIQETLPGMPSAA